MAAQGLTWDGLLGYISGKSLLSVEKLTGLRDAAEKAAAPIVEVGVWRGGSSAVLAWASDQPVFACDTFAGVIKTGPEDYYYQNGEHSDAPLEDVRQLLAPWRDQIHICAGAFPDETGHFMPEQIGLAHIDCDVYRSTIEAAQFLWPRLVKGGAIYFDDYGFYRTNGVTKAIDELKSLGSFELLPCGYAVLTKN